MPVAADPAMTDVSWTLRPRCVAVPQRGFRFEAALDELRAAGYPVHRRGGVGALLDSWRFSESLPEDAAWRSQAERGALEATRRHCDRPEWILGPCELGLGEDFSGMIPSLIESREIELALGGQASQDGSKGRL